ncbi:MAG: aminotransferase class V-fold PLP-dependent enzyme [Actinomycetales bacterium]|nr:aminotransferase class V-fold PLP-dependent enzyme [Actinomycetales bacterium]
MSSDDAAERFLDELYPYRHESETYRRIPDQGRAADEVIAEVRSFARREDEIGDDGRVSGTLYSGDHEHYHALSTVFEQFAHVNVLQRDMYPSATKFESEIIAMVADMLHGRSGEVDACGVVTSGGSESLITALYTYREQAAANRGVTRPNVVMPRTAHVALDKGAHWLGIEVRHAPLTDAYVADVDAMADLMDDNTIALVGSAANYAHGLIDPIGNLGALAMERGVGLHVDGCLGGFILPWIEANGVEVPLWDYRVPGVTSISADTHKFGYALKGTSVLTYRTKELRAHQWFAYPDWPGGLYVSPGFAGSRSGGLIASTWASLVMTGRQGYLAAARDIHDAAQRMVRGIGEIPGLEVIGEPTFLVAFTSDELDIYLVNDELKRRGWRMNALQLPAALHFCVTRPNTPDAVVDAFLGDLRAAAAYAAEHAGETSESGALYGFSGSLEGHATITGLMGGYLDALHDPAP